MTTAKKKPGRPKKAAGKKKPGRPRKAKPAPPADPTPAGGGPVPMALPLSRIDLSVSQAVRARTDAGRVDRYRERYAAGKPMDPVRVFAVAGDGGPDPAHPVWCGDGTHRVKAKRLADAGPDIDCLVSLHPTPETAEAAAWEHAAKANEAHGLTRSPYDVRAAVRAVLLRFPDLAAGSDRGVAEFCDCHRVVVKKARTELTEEGKLEGKAASTGRYADDPSPPSPPPPVPPPPVVDARPETSHPDEPEHPERPAAVRDQEGRPVPDTLAPAFAEGWRFSRGAGGLSETASCLASLLKGPAAGCLDGSGLTVELEALSRAFLDAKPHVVCPSCDGTARQGRRACPVCVGAGGGDSLGWVSRGGWERLTADQQEVCRGPWR